MWESLATDFPGQPVFNRGFGGSEVRDSTWYADRIVVPYAPCKVFFYAGDNDLNSGRSAVQVRDDVVAFVQRVHRDLPKTRVEYLSIKPSPSRAHLLPAINEANTLIKAALATLPNTGFTDIYTPMLGTDGQPDATLFREDMLHMTPAGYAIWTKALAPKVNCN
ncbi:MAG: SGNH/GDSL hydrolase family protein, partial [Pseudomonadota bacterium]